MASRQQFREMCEEAGQNNSTIGGHLKDCDYLAEVFSNIQLSNMIKAKDEKNQSLDPSAILETTLGSQNVSTFDLIPAVDDLDQGYERNRLTLSL